MRCPSAEETMEMLVYLLPRGRAWDGLSRRGSVMWSWWRGLADPLAEMDGRICAAWREWFCATMSVTRDWWLTDHGLPDACDPYPDPCVKRASLAASRCDEWSALAEAAGWSVDCALPDRCGARASGCRADGATARAASPWPGPLVVLTIDLAASSAYSAPQTRPALAGRYRAGQAVGCGPDISSLVCLLERMIPDHLEREWRTTNG